MILALVILSILFASATILFAAIFAMFAANNPPHHPSSLSSHCGASWHSSHLFNSIRTRTPNMSDDGWDSIWGPVFGAVLGVIIFFVVMLAVYVHLRSVSTRISTGSPGDEPNDDNGTEEDTSDGSPTASSHENDQDTLTNDSGYDADHSSQSTIVVPPQLPQSIPQRFTGAHYDLVEDELEEEELLYIAERGF